MEVNRLLGEEITYEMAIRGLPIGGTVAEKRLLLREALRSEKMGVNPDWHLGNFDSESELITCERKLLELEWDIQNFRHDNRDNEFKRIYSRLVHVNGRIGRIRPEGQAQIDFREKLIIKGLQLLHEVNLVFEGADENNIAGALSSSILRHTSEHNPVNALQRSIIDEPLLLLPEQVHHIPDTNPNVSYDLVDIPHSSSELRARSEDRQTDPVSKEALDRSNDISMKSSSGRRENNCKQEQSSGLGGGEATGLLHYRSDRKDQHSIPGGQHTTALPVEYPGAHIREEMPDVTVGRNILRENNV